MKAVLIVSAIVSFFGISFIMSSTLTGTIMEKKTGDRLLFAKVTLTQEGKLFVETNSDLAGNFEIINIPDGIYDLEVVQLGYESYKKKNLEFKNDQTFHLDIHLKPSKDSLEEIMVTESKGKHQRNKTALMSNDLAAAMDGRSINNIYYVKEVQDEEYDKSPESYFTSPATEPYSTFSLDVDKASYSNMRRMIGAGQLPSPDAVRLEELVNYFDYNYKEPIGKHPLNIISNYTDCPWNSNHKILHIGVKAKEVNYDNLPSSNFVFLIDVSGSMHDSNKLPLVISSFKMLLNKLRDHDRVAIVTYAGNAGVVLESTAAKDKKKILSSLDKLSAGGSTAGAQGIKTAYEIAEENFIRNGNNRVILATDGDFNVGVNSVEDLEKLIEHKRNSGIYLSVLGYGTGNYKDNKMQVLSDKGNGNHAYIDNIQEARKVFVTEFGGTLFTVAKDVKIQIEFNPAYVQSYRLLGYENRRLNKEDFNNDKKDAGDIGAGHTVTAIYEIIPVGVESIYASIVDPLKYQPNPETAHGNKNKELAEIKCRYKAPDGERSIKFSGLIENIPHPLSKMNEDLRFSLAVAEFALLVGESQFIDAKSLKNCIQKAETNKSNDPEGYKAEFVRLAKTVNDLHGSKWSVRDN